MYAARFGHADVVRVLLANEADVNAVDNVCILWMNSFVFVNILFDLFYFIFLWK